MEIAIIAHDLKKELMTQFCIAYCGILSKHNLCATSITAKYISEATGLEIEKLLAGVQGGKQQIASRVSCISEIRAPMLRRMRSIPNFCVCAIFTTFPLLPTSQLPRLLLQPLTAETWTGERSSIPVPATINA